MGDALPTVDLGTGRTAKAVAASSSHTCALLDDGSVKCWGAALALGLPDDLPHGSQPGQMGDALPALDLGAGRTAKLLAVGYYRSCAVLDDGTAKCWGDDPKAPAHTLPLPSPLAGSAGRMLGAGARGVYVLGLDGLLSGPLSPGTQPGLAVSGSVTTFTGSRDYVCVVRADGKASCPVFNGQVPPTTAKFDELGVGEQQFLCGLLPGGSVRCWGFSFSPWTYWTDSASTAADGVLVQIPERVSALASGGQFHMCALTVNGRVWCWGNNTIATGASGDPTKRGGVDENAWGPVDLGTRR